MEQDPPSGEDSQTPLTEAEAVVIAITKARELSGAEAQDESIELGGITTLLVNGRVLTGEDDPELLKRALLSDRNYIRTAIESAYEKYKNQPHHKDAQVERPPLPVTVLSDKPGKKGWNVIKEEAYWANTTGGIYTAMEDLQEKYQPFWLAVSESGFLPEVRIMGNRSGSRAYLYARLPEES